MYSKKIENFFKSNFVEFVILVLIFLSIVVAILSISVDSKIIESINLYLCVFFWVELSFRFFSEKSKISYLKKYIFDWIAVIPWEFIIIDSGNVNLQYIRLLRLIRLMRIIRLFSFLFSDFGKRLGYIVKKQIEKSIISQMYLLSITIVFIVLIFGFIFKFLNVNFEEGNTFWFSILTLFGADSLYTDTIKHDDTYVVKTIALILTFIGVIIFNGVFIAIVVSKIEEVIDNIKSGRGEVFEKNHYIFLGYERYVNNILDEMEIYCKTEKKRLKIVILTEKIEDEIRELYYKYRYLDIILREGKSYSIYDLKRLSIHDSKGILVFCDHNIENFTSFNVYDSFIIKTIMAINNLLVTNKDDFFYESYNGSIVTNIKKYDNKKYIEMVYDKNIKLEAINFSYIISKFLAMLIVHPKYYDVYNELMSYEGNEFHYYDHKNSLTESKFIDLFSMANDCLPVGVVRNNSTILIPDENFDIMPSDKIVVIAEDERSINFSKKLIFNKTIQQNKGKAITIEKIEEKNNKKIKKVAIFGFNNKLIYTLSEFHKINIKTDIFAKYDENDIENFILSVEENAKSFKKELFNYKKLDITELSEKDFNSDKLDYLMDYDKLIIVSNNFGNEDADYSYIDSETIFVLLALNKFFCEIKKNCNIGFIVELMNPENEEVIRSIKSIKYIHIVGNTIISKIINMGLIDIENLNVLVNNLLQFGGCDLNVYSINEEMEFDKVVISCYTNYKKIPIGLISDNKITINPEKNRIVKPQDEIIVIEKSQFQEN